MRKFYSYDSDSIITEEELRQEWESLDEYNRTSIFGDYIKACLSRNGDLKEVFED